MIKQIIFVVAIISLCLCGCDNTLKFTHITKGKCLESKGIDSSNYVEYVLVKNIPSRLDTIATLKLIIDYYDAYGIPLKEIKEMDGITAYYLFFTRIPIIQESFLLIKIEL